MKAKIMLEFEDKTKNREVMVDAGKRKGPSMLDYIDRQVTKKFSNEPWTRWNLLDIVESSTS